MSKLSGTAFQLKVWNYLKKIPKGKVKTYLDVAKGIGKPRAFRAVANALATALKALGFPMPLATSRYVLTFPLGIFFR